MNIHAEVQFWSMAAATRSPGDIDDAVVKFQWMLDPSARKRRPRLRSYFESNLGRTQGGWTLAYRHTVPLGGHYWTKNQMKINAASTTP
jgi:hypothetical protein